MTNIGERNMESNFDAVEVPSKNGFYLISGYSDYHISKQGDVYNWKLNHYLKGSKNPAGYINVRLTNDSRQTHTWGLHRLLGFVFKHPGCDISDLVINHKNGIKDDNDLENLEWLTEQENHEHAGLYGLTTKCLPVSIRNVFSGKVFKFPSATKCAMFLGITKDAVLWRIKSGEERVFKDGNQYRVGNDDREWITSNNIRSIALTTKPVVTRCLLSGKEHVYNKLEDLAKHSSVSQSTITSWLKKENQPVLPGLIQIKLLSDKSPWRHVDNPYDELELFTKEKCVLVKHIDSGDEELFFSAIDCCKKFDIRPSTLNYRLKTHPTGFTSNGYIYRYFNAI